MKTSRTHAVALVSLVSILWGSEWLANLPGENNIADLPHFRVLALRYFVAAIVLIPWLFLPPSPNQKTRPSIPILPNILLGIVLIALPTLYLAYRSDLSPGLVVLLFATLPLITSMLESSSGFSGAPAMLGGLAGTAFLVRGSLSSSPSQAISLVGLMVIVVAIAAVLVRAKHWLAIASVQGSVLVQMLTAGSLFALYSLVTERSPAIAWSVGQIAAVAALAVLGSAAAYCLFYSAMRDVKVSQLTVIQWLIPAVGILETVIRYRHLPEWASIAGWLLSITCALTLLLALKSDDQPLTLQITGTVDGENARQ